SGLITALAAEVSALPIKTLTVGFRQQAFDERALAREVAQRYATDHHELELDLNVNDDLPLIASAYGQPYADSSAIPSFMVARAAREHVKVILNGDGGDELFGGYRRHVAARLRDWVPGGEHFPIRHLARLAGALLPVPKTYRSRYAFLHRFLRGLGLSRSEALFAWMLDGMNGAELSCAMSPHNERVLDGDPWNDVLQDHELNVDRSDDFLAAMLAADRELILPYDLLVKIDIACMSHALEARSPLLDHHLIRGISSWDGRRLVGTRKTKPVLRSIAGHFLPRAVVDAPKRGFEVPLESWLNNEIRSLSREAILSRDGMITSIFDRDWLTSLLDKRQALDPARWSRRVYQLLMLALWDEARRKDQTGHDD
ncbi:MAG: asparagine synthetase B family protein, partial [Phycisphaerae bacterium]